MGIDGRIGDGDDALMHRPPDTERMQGVLEAIARGVEGFHIPASTDWPTAKLHFPDNDGQWKFSAVLVVIVPRPEPTILLTQRSSGLSEYSSHVSFPGGRPEPSDANVGATALREALEEICLDPNSVRLIGCLPLHKTRKRNHAIFPVVGIASDSAHWVVSPAEVEAIFEFPFSTLLNPDLPRQYVDGERAGAWYWADQAHDIWGVTAVILKSLAGLALAAKPAR